MEQQHTTPCNQCPWRINSAPGWLGDDTPIGFLQTSEAGHIMPCHMHIDYEDKQWEDQVESVPQCAGRSIHLANRCKSMPGVVKMKSDGKVFSNPQDFINHHTRNNDTKIMIIGNRVIITD